MYNYFLHVKTVLIIKKKQLLDLLSPIKNKNYTPFIILCEPRSGSTLLHTYLNSHSQIISYGEVLRDQVEAGNAKKDALRSIVFKPHAANLKAIGLKMFYDYFNDIHFKNDFQKIIKQSNIKVIHLIRKNQLKQYTSLKIAQNTNVWSSDLTAEKKYHKIKIDIEDFKKYLDQSESLRSMFSSLFETHQMLEISYEDLIAEPSKILADVQNFLSVQPEELFTLLKKQNTDSLQLLIENYDEVKNISF